MMDSNSVECPEVSVDEGAFWHTNMDLYYGFVPGEVIEVEHESNKYWLATIEYCFKHLVLLKWVGNYGEFWVDTSSANLPAINDLEFQDRAKRLFPLGYHLQSQVKSQFTLEKPSKVLIRPSLYNPSKDPYSGVTTIEDLLAHEIDQMNDTFASGTTSNNLEPGSVVLAKCKAKINYGQEDVDELETALQNLTQIENDSQKSDHGSPDIPGQVISESIAKLKHENQDKDSISTKDSGLESDTSDQHLTSNSSTSDATIKDKEHNTLMDPPKREIEQTNHEDDDKYLDACRKLQESAISKNRYNGVHENGKDSTDRIYFVKPKLFLDVGGANHERVFVPGTLLEICHTIESDNSLDIYHWFAFVIKNVGGRLTLRWFLCDEPKFKQGRLEPKSRHSALVTEDGEQHEGDENDGTKMPMISSKDITFIMHFCDPRVHTVSYARSNNRTYRLPEKITNAIKETGRQIDLAELSASQCIHVFDTRRINLDRDRPLIDHILSMARSRAPYYIDLVFAQKDKGSRREVLLSCPKMTKLVRGYVHREIETGVYEVHSDPLPETNEIIRFIHPFDSAYTILPLDWSKHNEDCLSVDPSRNASPTLVDGATNENEENDAPVTDADNTGTNFQDHQKQVDLPEKHCLKFARLNYPRSGASISSLPKISSNSEGVSQNIGDDECDPTSWSHALRIRELEATSFHFCIDYGLKKAVEDKFKVMDQLEVVHPSSDATIYHGRIRKIVYPLLWIQMSAECYTLLPFNSTNIYPSSWCEKHKHPLVSLLPPRKRGLDQTSLQNDRKKKKKAKLSERQRALNDAFEAEHLDLDTLNERQLDIDYILNEKSMYVKIYFNHKCFTGPSLSKTKISSLPQYVGPGPFKLVLEEVITKLISVAYVPPRLLNDLSSKTFEELLQSKDFTNYRRSSFKAKYQKRVHRETVPVCVNPDDIARYCELLCEHIKCCYNLFGPNSYDGDDCPGHCRALTKSNKFMKRATYYREKARLGEFNSGSESPASKKSTNNDCPIKTTRPAYNGRGSSDSVSSGNSRSDQPNNHNSPPDEVPTEKPKEVLHSVEENEIGTKAENPIVTQASEIPICDESFQSEGLSKIDMDIRNIIAKTQFKSEKLSQSEKVNDLDTTPMVEKEDENRPSRNNIILRKLPNSSEWKIGSEFHLSNCQKQPEDWTIEDVVQHLESCRLSTFKPRIRAEGIDGQALLLLDKNTISEYFRPTMKSEFTVEELQKLCRFVDFVRASMDVRANS